MPVHERVCTLLKDDPRIPVHSTSGKNRLVIPATQCIPCTFTRYWDKRLEKILWITLGSLLIGLGYLIAFTVPQEITHVERSALTDSPQEMGLYFENFEISPKDASLKIAGWWMPAENARATLVVIHGAGSNRNSLYFDSLPFYAAMVNHKVNVVAIDLRNHGDSDADGKGLQYGRTEMHDALAAIAWANMKTPDLPLLAMGISMGGATVIYAANHGADLDGIILLDSLLDTRDVLRQGGWISTGLPAALFSPSAWIATTFYGLPAGSDRALDVAAALELPILAIQDPDDPITRAKYSRELAIRNRRVTLWAAPLIPADHPDLAWRGRWGTHVAAFQFYPVATVGKIMQFITRVESSGHE